MEGTKLSLEECSGTKLSLEECSCPICMCVFIEPVTMPCKHSLCMPCYRQTVEKANLTCPVCRLRISVWARKASKANSLIDRKKWDAVRRAFPDKVQRRIEGKENDDEEDSVLETFEAQLRKLKELSKPGEIREEYEAELRKLQQQRDEEAKREEEASAALILALQQQEEKELEELNKQREEMERIDRETAQQVFQEVARDQTGITSPTAIRQKKVTRGLKKGKVTQPSQHSSNHLTLNTFFSPKPRHAVSAPAAADMQRQHSSSSDNSSNTSWRGFAPCSPIRCSSQISDDDTIHTDYADAFLPGPSRLFQPIVGCDRTPPKRLPNGRFHDPVLVSSTPKALFPLSPSVKGHAACHQKQLCDTAVSPNGQSFHENSAQGMSDSNPSSTLSSVVHFFGQYFKKVKKVDDVDVLISSAAVEHRSAVQSTADSAKHQVPTALHATASAEDNPPAALSRAHGAKSPTQAAKCTADGAKELSTTDAIVNSVNIDDSTKHPAMKCGDAEINLGPSHYSPVTDDNNDIVSISDISDDDTIVNSDFEGENGTLKQGDSPSSVCSITESCHDDETKILSEDSERKHVIKRTNKSCYDDTECFFDGDDSDHSISKKKTKPLQCELFPTVRISRISNNNITRDNRKRTVTRIKGKQKSKCNNNNHTTLDGYVMKGSMQKTSLQECSSSRDDTTHKASVSWDRLNEAGVSCDRLNEAGVSWDRLNKAGVSCDRLNSSCGEAEWDESDDMRSTMSQEEIDHMLAVKLQQMYSQLDKKGIKVDRFQGSEGEYSFRPKRQRRT